MAEFNQKGITQLSKEERLDMQMRGMNPLNDADVNRYMKGQGLSVKEKEERAKILFEGASNLGSAAERDFVPNVGDEPEVYEKITNKPAPVNLRQKLNEDFSDYGSTAGKVFNSDDLLDFKKKPAQPQKSAESLAQEGFESAKGYLNAFVINLQQPSYANRIGLFKALKLCLEAEAKFKDNQPMLQAFRKGVANAEKAMLQKIQG